MTWQRSKSNDQNLIDPNRLLIRDDAPVNLRRFLLELPRRGHFDNHQLQKIVCEVLGTWPDKRLPPYPDAERHVKTCAWYFIYDMFEAAFQVVRGKNVLFTQAGLEVLVREVNTRFMELNIGWQLVDGEILMRGGRAFELTKQTALRELHRANRPTAGRHIEQAIQALSQRPEANTSGAVSHATSATECVLHDITGEPLTLGKYLDKYPALKKALGGAYGYASDAGARHGKEGTVPDRADAEFTVALCAAAVTLLNRKHPRSRA
ncbi:MAG: AbiJ-NTD4 domain-containing protein [Bryobacteraceae bacterium]